VAAVGGAVWIVSGARVLQSSPPRGRKRDFADAERLLRRHVAGELILSFVPNAEQRLWRTMTRTKQQLTRDRVRAARLAAMADPKLRATPEQLQDALHAAATLSALHRQILGLFLARLELIEDQMEILNKSIGEALHAYHGVVAVSETNS
jgi:transposase